MQQEFSNPLIIDDIEDGTINKNTCYLYHIGISEIIKNRVYILTIYLKDHTEIVGYFYSDEGEANKDIYNLISAGFNISA